MAQNISLCEISWESRYLWNAHEPYPNSPHGLDPESNIPLVVKTSEDLAVTRLTQRMVDGPSGKGTYYIDTNKAYQEANRVIYYREEETNPNSTRWGTQHAIALHLSPNYRLFDQVNSVVVQRYIEDQKFIEHVLSKVAKTLTSLSDLSRSNTYRHSEGVIRRAILTYSEKPVDVITASVNLTIDAETMTGVMGVPPVHMAEVNKQGGDITALADRVLSRITPDIFGTLAIHVIEHLITSSELYDALVRYAPTWLKENSDGVPDDQMIIAWATKHYTKDDVVHFNVTPQEALSELKELPDHCVKDEWVTPLPSDIKVFTDELVTQFSVDNEPNYTDQTFDEIVSCQLERIEESGVLEIGTDWFMERINVDKSIIQHVRESFGITLEAFEPVDGVENKLFESVIRRIRVQQVATPALIEQCLEEAVQWNKDNITEYYGADLEEALKYYGFEPSDIKEIRWT